MAGDGDVLCRLPLSWGINQGPRAIVRWYQTHWGAVLIHRRGQRGQSMVELAIMIPLLSYLFLAIADFGRLVRPSRTRHDVG